MMKNLKLDRPIAFIDVETTGVNPNTDRVVELSVLKVHPDRKREYHSHRVNPGVPIPAEATAVHGISDADVAKESTFRQYAKSIRDFLEGCDNRLQHDLLLRSTAADWTTRPCVRVVTTTRRCDSEKELLTSEFVGDSDTVPIIHQITVRVLTNLPILS